MGNARTHAREQRKIRRQFVQRTLKRTRDNHREGNTPRQQGREANAAAHTWSRKCAPTSSDKTVKNAKRRTQLRPRMTRSGQRRGSNTKRSSTSAEQATQDTRRSAKTTGDDHRTMRRSQSSMITDQRDRKTSKATTTAATCRTTQTASTWPHAHTPEIPADRRRG